MKLTTWTFYDAQNLLDVKSNPLIKKDLVFLLLRPDINKPNVLMGLGIEKEKSTTKILDLQNKALSHNEIYEIFKNNLGVVSTKTIKEIELSGTNLSKKPIKKENAEIIFQVYNVFFKTMPITFDTHDYEDFSQGMPKEIFNELDFKKIPLNNVLQSLQLGMNEYSNQLKVIKSEGLSPEERDEKILRLSLLQSNLILFFDDAVRKLNEIIIKQDKTIKELKEKK